MKLREIVKAALVAVGLLVLNVLISIPVVLVYRFVIEPGHPPEFYNDAAMRIAPWCSHIAGTILFLGAGFLFARRRSNREALLFAVAFTLLYAFLDAASVAFTALVSIEFALSMLAKLAAALIGTYTAILRRASQTPAAET